jgi:1,4-alpha-glucan branching enzyme
MNEPNRLTPHVEALHRAGIGVILDRVPSHFPDDPHRLAFFDGTYLYEHADPRQDVHPEWHSRIFKYGCDEVRPFPLSSAAFRLEQ